MKQRVSSINAQPTDCQIHQEPQPRHNSLYFPTLLYATPPNHSQHLRFLVVYTPNATRLPKLYPDPVRTAL